MSYELSIVKRYLTSYKSSFLSTIAFIAIAGVFIGVAALVVVISVMTGFENQFRDSILATNSHIYVLKYFGEGVDDHEALADSLSRINGVVSVEPFVYSKGMIMSENELDGVAIRGLEVTSDKSSASKGMFGQEIVTGEFELNQTLSDTIPSKMILGVQLAEKLKATVGDTVILAFPEETSSAAMGAYFKMEDFVVTGIFDSGLYDYNATLCYISIPAAQQFFGLGDDVMGLELRVDDIYQAPKIASTLRERLEYPYSVTDWTQMNKEIFDLMKLQKVVVFLIITLIVIVAAFNIISTLIMMVMEKEKEVGILKAMGATAGSIMKIFMWEGVIIGAIGTGLGVLVGVILASSLQQYEFISISAEVYQLNTLPVEISVMDIIVISLISFSISFLATLYPARQAAKLMPVDAIRYE